MSLVMGEEYALKAYNKSVYEKATKLNTLGINYASYYDLYFDLKNIASDKNKDGTTVAGADSKRTFITTITPKEHALKVTSTLNVFSVN